MGQKKFCYSWPRKKIGLPYGNLRILRLTTVENKSISSGKKIVQIEKTWHGGFLYVGRV